ncbi:hypothetical protein K523DRAFT_416812 [Schizophyllum commune Tattone D]|nr:hypothetical protein K523DRAFT_416812 [Schizophyllum commune Tattone D]
MLDSVKKYVYERRRGLVKAAAIVGGAYLVRGYVGERLEEVKTRLEQQRAAEEGLRRRFRQNQEDVSYTVMALLPTLADQILTGMDVEALTRELQRSRRRRDPSAVSNPYTASTANSSAEMVQEVDARSEAGESSVYSAQSSSWVGEGSSFGARSPSADRGSGISESFLSTTSAASSVPEPASSSSTSPTSTASQSKTELWHSLKLLTLTRTLTTLYAITLLSLLTSLQLTLLARAKYVASVRRAAREEEVRDRLERELSLSSLLLRGATGGGGGGFDDLMGELLGDTEVGGEDAISEEAESMFLTMAWWILHVGWKDVGERVRRGVEEVFDGVSLKTKLSVADVHRLVCDVRRRVEYEVTFEGTERRVDFLSTLLPSTPETTQHVLTQGGFGLTEESFELPSEEEDGYDVEAELYGRREVVGRGDHALLEETRKTVLSPDFAYVLEACLDRGTEMLVSGLEDNDDEPRLRLAALLPGLARWSALALTGLPNQLVDGVLGGREVRALGAVVFARFEEEVGDQ